MSDGTTTMNFENFFNSIGNAESAGAYLTSAKDSVESCFQTLDTRVRKNYNASFTNIKSSLEATSIQTKNMATKLDEIYVAFKKIADEEITVDDDLETRIYDKMEEELSSTDLYDTGALITDEEYSESFWTKVGDFFGIIANALKKALATLVNTFVAIIQGILSALEAVLDAIIVVGGTIVGLGMSIANFFGADFDVDSFKAGMMNFVAQDWVGQLANAFYENTGVGQWVAENSLIKDTFFEKAIVGVGKWTGIIAAGAAIAYFTGGTALAPYVAGVAASVGIGEGAQASWANGGSFGQGLLSASVNGIINGFMGYTLGLGAEALVAKNALLTGNNFALGLVRNGSGMSTRWSWMLARNPITQASTSTALATTSTALSTFVQAPLPALVGQFGMAGVAAGSFGLGTLALGALGVGGLQAIKESAMGLSSTAQNGSTSTTTPSSGGVVHDDDDDDKNSNQTQEPSDDSQNGAQEQQPSDDGSQSGGQVQQPSGDSSQSGGQAQQPSGDSSQSGGQAQQPSGDSSQSGGQAQQPSGDGSQSGGQEQEPSDNSTADENSDGEEGADETLEEEVPTDGENAEENVQEDIDISNSTGWDRYQEALGDKVSDMYENDPEALKEQLGEYGYSDEQIEKIMSDEELAKEAVFRKEQAERMEMLLDIHENYQENPDKLIEQLKEYDYTDKEIEIIMKDEKLVREAFTSAELNNDFGITEDSFDRVLEINDMYYNDPDKLKDLLKEYEFSDRQIDYLMDDREMLQEAILAYEDQKKFEDSLSDIEIPNAGVEQPDYVINEDGTVTYYQGDNQSVVGSLEDIQNAQVNIPDIINNGDNVVQNPENGSQDNSNGNNSNSNTSMGIDENGNIIFN